MTGLIVAAVAFVLFVVWLVRGLRHANKVIAEVPVQASHVRIVHPEQAPRG